MSVNNSHQVSRYYDFYRDREIIFTKANLKFLRIDPRQIYIKSPSGQWPCIINSVSLMSAKIIIGTSSGIYAALTKSKNMTLSLRFCFIDLNNNPIHFFVNCTIDGIKQYEGSNELVLVTLQYTQRPPDDLIIRIGEFVEVNENFKNRREERITITKDSLRELQIPKEETFIFISNVPRRCILKDISFGGAKVMLIGIPKFLLNKQVDLRLMFQDTTEKISLIGNVINADFLPGRKDICVCNIQFITDSVPMSYKFRINSYITSYQKKIIENQILNNAKAANAQLLQNQQLMQAAQAKAAVQTNSAASAGSGQAQNTQAAAVQTPKPETTSNQKASNIQQSSEAQKVQSAENNAAATEESKVEQQNLTQSVKAPEQAVKTENNSAVAGTEKQ